MKITDIYYFSATHWDREWYRTFQDFRSRLVENTDELLTLLETDKDYETFHFDGQTIVLEDYCEIAPENTERLKKLINDGKIKIGPWYDMPDEFLLSGESLIRNLIKGEQLSRNWGVEPWKVGYVCDIFGHIAQMPQIFNGFDINCSVLGRGTNEDDPAYFIWRSPDGSDCLNFRLEPNNGYGSLSIFLSQNQAEQDFEEKLKEYLNSEENRSNTSVMILMDGIDHQGVRLETSQLLKTIKKLYPDANVHHCDLFEAFKQLEAVREELPVIAGELNKTAKDRHGYLQLITYTLSSYYTHKKANDECQNLLEKKIEPMLALSQIEGKKIRRSYRDLAYKYLLQNHPHDSICGCSIEQVHKDMVYRFDQVKEIAGVIKDKFIANIKPDECKSGRYLLRLYNPLPFERTESVTADIILPKDFPNKYADPFVNEYVCSFKLRDAAGNEIPYGIVDVVRNYKGTYKGSGNYEYGECYKITFEAKIPAGGYSEYCITPYEKSSRYLEKLCSGRDFAENEYIRMEISSQGELSLLDKKTGMVYSELCSLVDDGEIGDGWGHGSPLNNTTVYSKGFSAIIENIESSPSRCVFKITKYMEVPRKVDDLNTGKKRSSEFIKLPVVFTVGLSKSSRFVDVNLKITNTARDHRMRLTVPTGIENDKYFAGQTFYCNERKTGIDYNTQTWREREAYEKQMNGIVGKRRQDDCGLAFISAYGLHECSVLGNGDMHITLFRAFQKTVRTMGEPGGQLLGELSYDFLLAPLDNEVTYSELVRLQDRLAVKPDVMVASIKDDYTLSTKSYMKLTGDSLNLSIVKVPESGEENAVIVRVFNSSDKEVDGKILFDRKICKAFKAKLNESVTDELSVSGCELAVTLSPWKIQTYKIIF